MIYLKKQKNLHPTMEAQDVIKMCYQAAFGAEHLICDSEKAKGYLLSEFESVSETNEAIYEPISDKVCRVNLGAWKKRGLPSLWLYKMFELSAKIDSDAEKAIAEHLSEATRFFPQFAPDFQEYLNGGIRAVHHSDCYRLAEQPHYRVVSADLVKLIPLLEKISSSNAKVVSIDGKAASGKTTMTKALCHITGASAVHMDDFFLPPALRTPERLTEAGGNIHYERFSREVLPFIKSGKAFCYTVFDCSIMDYGDKRCVESAPYIVVEGAYSHHPKFGDYADIKVFADISPEKQMERILLRNGEKMAEMFCSRWIPMEEKYYHTFNIKENADLVIEA